ncbi:MAG: IPT/TIG domain-containing protein [Longimicrobiales bacterium]|nr:IPT/TIG domain-containing protein [Longimicrobiales bacterium]
MRTSAREFTDPPAARSVPEHGARSWSGRARAVRLGLLPALLGIFVACGGDDGPTATEQPTQPSIASVSPNEGTAGTEVRIDGTGFEDGTQVFFDGLESPRVQLESGSLFALAPTGIALGTTYDVRVVNTVQSLEAADTAEATFTGITPGNLRVNGVTKPRGLEGMTVIIEGRAFGDSLDLSEGQVFFEATDGSALQATVSDPTTDWADDFIVTSVPAGIADTSKVWVETLLGASDSVEFRLLQSGEFSPSNINWTQTTALPQPLQGLGAVFVPVESGSAPANYVFTMGGADGTNTAQAAVYRNTVQQTGELSGSWSTLTDMPGARAYHTATAATAFTAALDTTTTVAVLYALGGVDETGATVSTVQMARVAPDGSVGAWQTTTDLPAGLHSASAAVFRGYLYVAGGADASDVAQSAMYRAKVNEDGTLGSWTQMDNLPAAMAYGSLVNFGPFLYAVGGETATSAPVTSTQTGTETAQVYFARLNLRTADLDDTGWIATETMAKARSKHSTVFAGGALFVTSGIFSGTPGSSENAFAVLNSDGTLQPWQGATGAETINAELGKSLYNQAMVTFIDDSGTGHLLVLGGADIANEGTPSDAVVWY